jgi:hypothetical protein
MGTSTGGKTLQVDVAASPPLARAPSSPPPLAAAKDCPVVEIPYFVVEQMFN